MHPRFLPRLILACGLAALVAPAARADVKLHPLFTDHMGLQRELPVPELVPTVGQPARGPEPVRSDGRSRVTAIDPRPEPHAARGRLPGSECFGPSEPRTRQVTPVQSWLGSREPDVDLKATGAKPFL